MSAEPAPEQAAPAAREAAPDPAEPASPQVAARRSASPRPKGHPEGELSIGEVVALLSPEFSDLTVSKIRFLEERGLIAPGRTATGHRSFSPHHVAVLHWILSRQRDQFLPLSIIGERIERGEHLAEIFDGDPQGLAEHDRRRDGDATGEAEDGEEGEAATGGAGHDAGDTGVAGDYLEVGFGARLSDWHVYTAAELAAQSGLDIDAIGELQSFGLIVPLSKAELERVETRQPPDEQARRHLRPPEPRFGAAALQVARIAREFATHGLAARHLRVIRNAAVRDASIISQAVQPVLHSGSHTAGDDARRSLGRLAELAERLRKLLIVEATAEYWER